MVLWDIITFSILFIFAVRYMWLFFRTVTPSSAALVSIMIFVMYGIPITFKYIGMGGYYNATFNAALMDQAVHWKYNLVVLVGVFILWLTSIRGPVSKLKGFLWSDISIDLTRLQIATIFAWLALLLPILTVILLAPDKSAYLKYGNIAVRGIHGLRGTLALNLVAYGARISLLAYFLIRHSEYTKTGRIWTLVLSWQQCLC